MTENLIMVGILYKKFMLKSISFGVLFIMRFFNLNNERRPYMNINTSLISNNNSYAGQTPLYIVIHNTDNTAKTADAKAHATAQHNGNFHGYSAHVFVDDKSAYQALPYNRGSWHVGVNYGGKLFGTVNNHNSIGIEMCMNAGYNYEKAFQNTVDVCKQLMKKYGIPAIRVVQHYDVCAKNCPSVIRGKGDWDRFKKLISGESVTVPTTKPTAKVDKYYRVRKTWKDSKSQIGAYKSLKNAKKACKAGYSVFDWNGKAVYSVTTKKSITQVAKEVINGEWGNGQDRRDRLEAAGYNYTEVQNAVNKLLK
jgi:N-acetylmuramoyl-L-alanine amidase CwlA